MCKEACAINEEAEKQITDLQLEIEAAKDTKGIISTYEETLEMLRNMVSLLLHTNQLISSYLPLTEPNYALLWYEKSFTL